MKVVVVLYPVRLKVEFGEPKWQLIPGSGERVKQREWLESNGDELVTTTDHEGDELEENLQDADILITTPSGRSTPHER